jgi:aquaporin Z
MKKYVAEMIGTFAIVFCGTGAISIDAATNGNISHAGVALTWGLIVMTMIYTFGSNSGAHFNPAVSVAFALTNRFPYRLLLPYIISQCAGAIAASALLRLLFPSDIFLGASLPAGAAMQSFILELILSFLLMLVILHVACGSKEEGLFSGIVIGGVVGLEAMFAGPVCGASMNPARSLGPALVSGHTEFLWLYWVAPLSGMALAVPLFKFMKKEAILTQP